MFPGCHCTVTVMCVWGGQLHDPVFIPCWPDYSAYDISDCLTCDLTEKMTNFN